MPVKNFLKCSGLSLIVLTVSFIAAVVTRFNFYGQFLRDIFMLIFQAPISQFLYSWWRYKSIRFDIKRHVKYVIEPVELHLGLESLKFKLIAPKLMALESIQIRTCETSSLSKVLRKRSQNYWFAEWKLIFIIILYTMFRRSLGSGAYWRTGAARAHWKTNQLRLGINAAA